MNITYTPVNPRPVAPRNYKAALPNCVYIASVDNTYDVYMEPDAERDGRPSFYFLPNPHDANDGDFSYVVGHTLEHFMHSREPHEGYVTSVLEFLALYCKAAM